LVFFSARSKAEPNQKRKATSAPPPVRHSKPRNKVQGSLDPESMPFVTLAVFEPESRLNLLTLYVRFDLLLLRKKPYHRMKQPCVYILASKQIGTLYVGVTSDLVSRVWQHKNDLVEGFTKRYRVHNLVWYELHSSMDSAIAREKDIKRWQRRWKIQLIEEANPEWKDLYSALCRS
jgi:putative endonuclease